VIDVIPGFVLVRFENSHVIKEEWMESDSARLTPHGETRPSHSYPDSPVMDFDDDD
jgi:hypothetical protein